MPVAYSGPPKSAERTFEQANGTLVVTQVGLELQHSETLLGEDAHALPPLPTSDCPTVVCQGTD